MPEPQPDEHAAQLAEKQSVTLDRQVVVALVEELADVFPDDALEQRAHRGTRQGFDDSMQDVPDVEPPDFDQLPGDLHPGK